MKWWQNKYNIILIAILVIAILLRLYNIPGSDIQNDAALNTLRAFGWFDFLLNPDQTTPIVWFGSVPWWGHLSFHDIPPLVQAIQFIFLNLFGAASLAALLPFILAGSLSVYLLYWLSKKFVTSHQALLIAGLFSITSYAIWASRTAYLEGISILFIILSCGLFLFFLKTNKNRYLYYWALALALALLSKYTALFLLPAVIFYILIYRPDIFKNKHFYLSIIMMLIVLSPVIIYNIMMYKTRGHFDAALSSMLGIQTQDFAALANRSANTNFLQNIGSIFIVLYKSTSIFLFILYILSFIYMLLNLIKRQKNILLNFVGLNIVVIFIMFAASGAPPRLLSIIIPFFSIITGLFIINVLASFKKASKLLVSLLVIIFLGELFYALNTNIFKNPQGQRFMTYSGYRFYDRGFEELDNYLQTEIIGDLPNRINPKNLDNMTKIEINTDWVILFDERADWFSQMWYIDRYMIYYDLPLMSIKYVDQIDTSNKDIYFVYTTEAGNRSGQSEDYNRQIEIFKNDLEASNIKAIKEIRDYKDDVVFKIYYINYNQ